ncbi:MAG: MutS-related protein [Spirochaetaceae bacterium]
MTFELLSQLSLLQPPGTAENAYRHIPDRVYEDLNFSHLLRAVSKERLGEHRFDRILRRLPVVPSVSQYRAEIVADLRLNPKLTEELHREVDACRELASARYSYSEDLLETVGRLTELDLFVDRVRAFSAVLARRRESLRSQGLRRFDEALQEATEAETFKTLEVELPRLRKELRNRRSLTVGINLDDKMRPMAATLISVNEEPFGEQSSLQRVLSRFTPQGARQPLHTNDLPDSLRRSDGSAPALSPLFRDLEQLLRSIVRPVAKGLRQYSYLQTTLIGEIAEELSLLLGIVDLCDSLEAKGFPTVSAKLRNPGTSHPEVILRGLYALSLPESASVDEVVRNDFIAEQGDALLILTGPNSGGKTTYLRAVAQAQFLAQHGFPVPAEEAEIPMVPGILSLFAAGDTPQATAEGRLAQELRQLSQMIGEAPPEALYFFNEAFSSTGTDDALEIAETVIRGIVDSGGRVLFATHLHALAGKRDELSEEFGEPEVVNLVARTDREVPTFRIERGEPEGRSYAARLVKEYGLDHDALLRRIRGSA